MLEEQKEWEGDFEKSQQRMDKVPVHLIHNGPTFEFTTSSGEKVICESKFFNYKDHWGESGLEVVATKDVVNGIYLYIYGKTKNGEIVVLRSGPIVRRLNGEFEARSKITVKKRGKGFARPTDEAFCRMLQWLANRMKQKINWIVQNQNLEKVEEIEKNEFSDSEKLKRAKIEQERWKKLYGEEGYFKIHNGKRTFEPEKGVEADLAGTKKQIDNLLKPKVFYRGRTFNNPKTVTAEELLQSMEPGSSREATEEEVARNSAVAGKVVNDGNEYGIYMSDNDLVGNIYALGGNNSVEVPKHSLGNGQRNRIKLPTLGVAYIIDGTLIESRLPKISGVLQGVENNGFQGREWISDTVPSGTFGVSRLALNLGANDRENIVIELGNSKDLQIIEDALKKLRDHYARHEARALAFKEYLEELEPQKRQNEFITKRKWEELTRTIGV